MTHKLNEAAMREAFDAWYDSEECFDKAYADEPSFNAGYKAAHKNQRQHDFRGRYDRLKGKKIVFNTISPFAEEENFETLESAWQLIRDMLAYIEGENDE